MTTFSVPEEPCSVWPYLRFEAASVRLPVIVPVPLGRDDPVPNVERVDRERAAG